MIFSSHAYTGFRSGYIPLLRELGTTGSFRFSECCFHLSLRPVILDPGKISPDWPFGCHRLAALAGRGV